MSTYLPPCSAAFDLSCFSSASCGLQNPTPLGSEQQLIPPGASAGRSPPPQRPAEAGERPWGRAAVPPLTATLLWESGRPRCRRNPQDLTPRSRWRGPRSSGLPLSRPGPAAPSPALSAAPPCSAGDAPPSCMLTLWRHVRPEVPAPSPGPREAFIREQPEWAWPREGAANGGVPCVPALTRRPPCCRIMRHRLGPAPGRVRPVPFQLRLLLLRCPRPAPDAPAVCSPRFASS